MICLTELMIIIGGCAVIAALCVVGLIILNP